EGSDRSPRERAQERNAFERRRSRRGRRRGPERSPPGSPVLRRYRRGGHPRSSARLPEKLRLVAALRQLANDPGRFRSRMLPVLFEDQLQLLADELRSGDPPRSRGTREQRVHARLESDRGRLLSGECHASTITAARRRRKGRQSRLTHRIPPTPRLELAGRRPSTTRAAAARQPSGDSDPSARTELRSEGADARRETPGLGEKDPSILGNRL